MASLILTAVGGVLGGPIGAAIGALAGQTIDRAVLFKPKGRQGPRLTELAVQTSSYGTPIPRLFGAMRVAGTVIWSTDLIESKAKSSSGKGQPSVTNFSYAASFAVLLSARPITGIGRIWADGKLLRGAGGDLKASTGFRVHLGGADQAPDPVIVAAEGMGQVPAHRGYAYAVFEMLQLADYGNRIPSLTFEVFADPRPVPLGVIAEAISEGRVDGSAITMPMTGFSAYGDSARGVLETLSIASGGWFSPQGDRLVMRDANSATGQIVTDHGAAAIGTRGRRRQRAVAAIGTVPLTLAISHYDPARDYQTSLQRARRPGAGGRSEQIELPAAMDGAAAKAIAIAALARAEAGRERREITLDWRAMRIVPGDIVTINDADGRWRVARVSLEAMVTMLELVRLDDAAVTMVAASSGRVRGSVDTEHGPTILHVAELPALGDNLADTPRLLVAAAGAEPGWRRAALLLSTDGGARWSPMGSTAAPATIGTLATPAPAAPATVRDLSTVIEIDLVHAEMALVGADDVALDSGANLALLGDELIQFGQAEQIGSTRWRLRRLLRGRRGTEAAAGTQQIGDRFVIIDADDLTTIDIPLSTIGSSVRLMASGVGDLDGPVTANIVPSGASVRPPSPAHLRARRDGTLLTIEWVRRSRAGWRWIDRVDSPVAEEGEHYVIDVAVGGAPVAQFATTQPFIDVTIPAAISPAVISVRQRGANGDSPASMLILP